MMTDPGTRGFRGSSSETVRFVSFNLSLHSSPSSQEVSTSCKSYLVLFYHILKPCQSSVMVLANVINLILFYVSPIERKGLTSSSGFPRKLKIPSWNRASAITLCSLMCKPFSLILPSAAAYPDFKQCIQDICHDNLAPYPKPPFLQ